jgi:hypothetical protein
MTAWYDRPSILNPVPSVTTGDTSTPRWILMPVAYCFICQVGMAESEKPYCPEHDDEWLF